MPINVTPQDAAAKWASNLGAATASIQRGVNAVTVAPGQRAAAQKTKWLTRIQQSADKWAQRVGSVSLGDWQNAMNSYGIPRIAQGATAKQAKYANFASQFYPYLEQGMAKVHSMSNTSLEDSINRMTAMVRHNAAFRRSGTSS